MGKLLIVEDEKPINELIERNLTLVGHHCVCVFNGEDALEYMDKADFDLIILDIMLTKMSGFEVIKRIKHVPVIFLTAFDSLQHKIKGFDLGADDYITKPFEILELIARVQAVLKRTQKNEKVFLYSGIRVDLEAHKVFAGESEISLTPKEYVLLETLIINRNIALSREKLLELAWGYDYLGDTRTVDVHIQKLRSKLCWEDKIKTVYKYGYRLEV